MDHHLLPYLQILRTQKVGPKTFFRLLKQFDQDHELILKFLKNNDFNIPSLYSIQKEIDTLYRLKGKLLFYQNNDYPLYLKNIDDAPPFLYVLGNSDIFKKEAISIVGARNASLTGQRFISRLATYFKDQGFAIVSGLARGMDTAAHKASLEGGTIAVLSGGIDQIYPLENKTLYEHIQKKGVIVSEMPLGTAPSAQLFARRNRIVSGLSRATIIAEAAKHSGSMITADFALQQGREVFVVPGHPSDPRSEGGNFLIQQGAHLLQKEQDVLDILRELPVIFEKPTHKIPSFNTKETFLKDENKIIKKETDVTDLESKILELLSDKPIQMEDLFESFPSIDISDLMALISQLDLKGLIVLHANQSVSLST